MSVDNVYYARLMGCGYLPQKASVEERLVHDVLHEAESGDEATLQKKLVQLPTDKNKCILLMTAWQMLKDMHRNGQAISNLEGKVKLISDEFDETIEKLSIPKLSFVRAFFRKELKYEMHSKDVVVPQTDYRLGKDEDAYQFRAGIFTETLRACRVGYQNSKGIVVRVDNESMKQKTETYAEVAPLPEPKVRYQTQFKVITEDTLQVMMKRKAEGGNPAGVNFANRDHPGGGVVEGCPAQEEALCRSTNHILGLWTQQYPFPEVGGIYCPCVQVIRSNEAQGYAFLDEPQELALVAAAAYDLREGTRDRANLGFPPRGPIREEDLRNSAEYMDKTRAKIRNLLRIMAAKGHEEVVLGAFGCGAFKNPPELMASLFFDVLNDPEFKGRFKKVDFAILKIFPNDQQNVDTFSRICEKLKVANKI